MVSKDGTTMLVSDSGFLTYPDAKYYDKYSYNSIYSNRIINKLGDGIKEVVVDTMNHYGWYNDRSYNAGASSPWFIRGGSYSLGSYAGVFLSNNNTGQALEVISSCLIIVP